jgi:rRNA processing protein Gar1
MNEVGEILHVAKSGRIIIKVTNYDPKKIGRLVTDKSGKKLGKIVELLGPVSSPFASIIAEINPNNVIGGGKVFEKQFNSKNVFSRKKRRNTK